MFKLIFYVKYSKNIYFFLILVIFKIELKFKDKYKIK